MKIAAVIPTRNEADSIGRLVKGLWPHFDEIIVADDSDDLTPLVAIEAGARVVETSGGLGQAYKDAWAKIDEDWYVLHCDAGGSHRLEDIFAVARRSPGVAIGSRFCFGGAHTGSRRRAATSKLAAWACNRVTDRDIADWTSGLRCYTPSARAQLQRHEFVTSGHAWQIEALHTLIDYGYLPTEVPIRYLPSRSHLTRARAKEAFDYWREHMQ